MSNPRTFFWNTPDFAHPNNYLGWAQANITRYSWCAPITWSVFAVSCTLFHNQSNKEKESRKGWNSTSGWRTLRACLAAQPDLCLVFVAVFRSFPIAHNENLIRLWQQFWFLHDWLVALRGRNFSDAKVFFARKNWSRKSKLRLFSLLIIGFGQRHAFLVAEFSMSLNNFLIANQKCCLGNTCYRLTVYFYFLLFSTRMLIYDSRFGFYLVFWDFSIL